MPPTPKSIDSCMCDVIATDTEIGDEDEMISAKNTLSAILEADEVYVETKTAPIAVGNRRGLRLAALPGDLASLKAVFSAIRGPGGAPWGNCQEPQTAGDGGGRHE